MKDKLTELLRKEEGEVLSAYQDHLGYWTIGVGRLIDKRKGGGITAEESAYLLSNDIDKKMSEVYKALPWIEQLDDARKAILISMAFQMGLTGLQGFKNTLAMVQAGKYKEAAVGLLNSKWAQQTPNRAKRHAEQMRTGEWQT